MQHVTIIDKFCYYGKHICNTKILKTNLINHPIFRDPIS